MQSPLKEQPGAFISYLTSFQNPQQGQCHHMVKEGQKCKGGEIGMDHFSSCIPLKILKPRN